VFNHLIVYEPFIVAFCVIALYTLVLLGILPPPLGLQRRKTVDDLFEKLQGAIRVADDAVKTSYDAALAERALRESVETEARAAATLQKAELANEMRKREEVVAKIEGILGEKKSWSDLYQSQARAHAAAQDLLLRELEACVRQYEGLTRLVTASKSLEDAHVAARRKLKLGRAAQIVAQEFRLEFVTRQLESEKDLTVPKTQESEPGPQAAG